MKKLTMFLAIVIMVVTVVSFLSVNVSAYDYGSAISNID